MFVERLWRSIKYEEVYLHAYKTVSEAPRSATWLVVQVANVDAALHPGTGRPAGRPDGGDPTLILWQEWRAAHDQVESSAEGSSGWKPH